jgi:serine/threonine-protein kinase
MKEGALLNNRYQLLDRLGSGGMADVFRARDLMLDRYVAIKLLREDYSRNVSFQERFRQEARAAANLSHPNIVTVHDFGVDENGLVYIIMEYIPGKDMKSILRQRGRFTVEEGIPLMIQACAGIGYAHRAGLVHCDVKPHNMLVSPDRRLKVTDFGIARALATILPGEKTDMVWGSPQYFSPEQAAGEAPSPASDVYSLGVVLYEMLTGTPPFTASTPDELARLHLHAQPIPISEYVPDVPAALEEIVMKVLSKEPAARYRTADQLGRVLIKFGAKRDEPPAPALSLTPEVAAQFQPQETDAPPPASFADDEPESSAPNIDWTTVGLALGALTAVGALIPLWLYIWFLYNPPLR